MLRRSAKVHKTAVRALAAVCCAAIAAAGCAKPAPPADVVVNTVETAALIETDASVTVAAADSGTGADGLLVSADRAYTGAIAGLFTGDTRIRFGFRDGVPGRQTFTVTVADHADPSRCFDIVYTTVWWAPDDGGKPEQSHTGAYVRYNDEVRTSQDWNAADVWFDHLRIADAFLAAPMAPGYVTGPQYGILDLSWQDGILSVSVSQHQAAGNTRVIAAFDSSDGVGFLSGERWGLPPMRFADGYTISFSSAGATETDDAADVYFSEIVTDENGRPRTYDLRQETLETPHFYATDTQ